MGITIHRDIVQGSEEWHSLRGGILTASKMKHLLTEAKLEPAKNDKERAIFYEIMAQRITGYTPPEFQSFDMMRGHEEELEARMKYSEHIKPVEQVGFITNDKFGFTIGFSPDGLVDDDGLIEVKSRKDKFQLETILKNEMPSEFSIQVQTGLLVSERKWCDFISYCGGLPMMPLRIMADERIQAAIVKAATAFESRMADAMEQYREILADPRNRLIQTERKEYNTGEITA